MAFPDTRQSIANDAYAQLYGKEPDRRLEVKYHGNLKGYNATVRKSPTAIVFTLSRGFERCEPEIQIGVMQYLLNKLNKTKTRTDYIDMYHTFVKKMSDIAPVTKSDPQLERSFARCDERFFGGMMTRPNLAWGGENQTLLGTYTYATDTIMISHVLEAADQETLDYVMYHEMLHKKHKFDNSANRTRSHTRIFRADERRFVRADGKDPEAVLKSHLRASKRTRRTAGGRQRNFVERLMGWP